MKDYFHYNIRKQKSLSSAFRGELHQKQTVLKYQELLMLLQFFYHNVGSNNFESKYQPSGEGGTRSAPATPRRLQNPIWPPGGSKMADGVWKGV